MPKTTRLEVFAEQQSEGSTGQQFDDAGTKRGTIWAELQSRETERKVDDKREVTKEKVEYLINERAKIDKEDWFKRTKTGAPLYQAKSISMTEEGDTGNRILKGVRTE